MSNRIKAAPSLLVAAFLASLVSIATTCVAARVASDCLHGPKHQAPPRWSLVLSLCSPTNRKCWFVGDEGQKVSQVVAQRPSATERRRAYASVAQLLSMICVLAPSFCSLICGIPLTDMAGLRVIKAERERAYGC